MNTQPSHPPPAAAARVTAQIANLLARGVRPWRKSWDDTLVGPTLLPLRANGTPYRGMNVVALWAAAIEAGFTSPFWFTFKQALAAGGQVRKGERGSFVIFYKPVTATKSVGVAEDQSEEQSGRAVLRGYVVFNRAQIDGLDAGFDPPAPIILTQPDNYASRFGRVPATVMHGGGRAFYAPSTDHVQMPPQSAFGDLTQYYATLAHEFGHWTRHPSRLDRDFGQKRFGDCGYAMEDLVAELCAAFVGAVIGLPPDHLEDHASYIESWLRVLADQPSAFLSAAGKAQLAADYLLRLMGETPAGEQPGERGTSRDEICAPDYAA